MGDDTGDAVKKTLEKGVEKAASAQWKGGALVSTEAGMDAAQARSILREVLTVWAFCIVSAIVAIIAGNEEHRVAGAALSVVGGYSLVRGYAYAKPGLGRAAIITGMKGRIIGLVLLAIGIWLLGGGAPGASDASYMDDRIEGEPL